MTAPIVILDTETTSLRRDRRAWEVAMIRIDEIGVREISVFVMDVDLSNADPMSLKIGRFHERHPSFGSGRIEGSNQYLEPEEGVVDLVDNWTRGAHIVGAVPNFDTEVLGDMLYRHKLCPTWHYHLQDVETLVAGFLIGKGDPPDLPWKSDDLSRAVGVNPENYDRHTALGDCRWALAQLRAVAPYLVAGGAA